MQNKPIKRSKGLVPLSRQHHDGLLLCWKIRTGIAKNIPSDRIVAYTLYFYENFLKPHFEEEEMYVFSVLTDDDVLKKQALMQHTLLRAMINMISTGENTIAKLKTFATELGDHIRFEERQLFNHIQEQLGEDAMAGLEEKLAQMHNNNTEERWVDTFWNYKN